MIHSTWEFFLEAEREFFRARAKFPPAGNLVALIEEVGELAKALQEESPERVAEEAVQVAAMAARLALEMDPTLNGIRERLNADKG